MTFLTAAADRGVPDKDGYIKDRVEENLNITKT